MDKYDVGVLLLNLFSVRKAESVKIHDVQKALKFLDSSSLSLGQLLAIQDMILTLYSKRYKEHVGHISVEELTVAINLLINTK